MVVTGSLLTREWSAPIPKVLATGEAGLEALGVLLIPLFWGVAASLLWWLVLPTWQGDRWRRRALGACDIASCAGALHWLSYEPVPGSGSWRAGIAVALLFASGAATAVLAERVDARWGRLGIAGAALGAAAIIVGSVSAVDGSCDADAEVSVAVPSSGGEPSALAAVKRLAEHARGKPLHVPARGWSLVSQGQSRALYQAEDVQVSVRRLEDQSWVVEQARCISG